MKVFWSWQADTPGKMGRDFMRDALIEAIEALKEPEVLPPPTTKIMLALLFVALLSPVSITAAARPVSTPPPQAAVNRGVVELETGRGSGISVTVTEDLANIVDDGATRRVLSVVGKGGIGNITDLELLHGVDLAILQDDVMNYARQQNQFAGIEN